MNIYQPRSRSVATVRFKTKALKIAAKSEFASAFEKAKAALLRVVANEKHSNEF